MEESRDRNDAPIAHYSESESESESESGELFKRKRERKSLCWTIGGLPATRARHAGVTADLQSTSNSPQDREDAINLPSCVRCATSPSPTEQPRLRPRPPGRSAFCFLFSKNLLVAKTFTSKTPRVRTIILHPSRHPSPSPSPRGSRYLPLSRQPR